MASVASVVLMALMASRWLSNASALFIWLILLALLALLALVVRDRHSEEPVQVLGVALGAAGRGRLSSRLALAEYACR